MGQKTEQKWVLPSGDGQHQIYGVSNRAPNNRRAILYVHGFSGSAYDTAANALAHQLPPLGYDVLRLYLYSGEPGGRCLTDCTIQIHAQDVDTVVQHFRPQYEAFYACGHSYGGPSLLSTTQLNSLNAVSLWDPSYTPCQTISERYDLRGHGDGLFSIRLNFRVMLSAAMLAEAQKFDRARAIALAQTCQIPLQLVHAGQAYWINAYDGESFHSNSRGLTDYQVIPEATHSFAGGDCPDQLIALTKTWFDQF
ncbi:MAG: alpha/beta hydrolase [Alphaproteobacteria bacterium]|nr:alpha/beta hydrolase [Alphaproteobacteria bacterium]